MLPGNYPGSQLLRTHPPPSCLKLHFPAVTGYRAYLLREFLPGASRASPVACYVLANMPSLSPRWNKTNASSSFRLPMLPSPRSCGLGFQNLTLSRPPMRLLSLRPADLLITPKVTLSIGFKKFGYPPLCYPSYRVPGFYPGGSISH